MPETESAIKIHSSETRDAGTRVKSAEGGGTSGVEERWKKERWLLDERERQGLEAWMRHMR